MNANNHQRTNATARLAPALGAVAEYADLQCRLAVIHLQDSARRMQTAVAFGLVAATLMIAATLLALAASAYVLVERYEMSPLLALGACAAVTAAIGLSFAIVAAFFLRRAITIVTRSGGEIRNNVRSVFRDVTNL